MAAPHNKGKGEAISWLLANVGYQGDDCLTWPFARNRQKGYGMLGYLGKSRYAHRTMCELAHGPAPSSKHQATHSCGQGHEGCVHPRHLAWKTNSANQLERRGHGRNDETKCGNRTYLTPHQVLQIRQLRGIKTQREIASMLGIKVGSVEYWQRHNRLPLSLSNTRNSRWRRARGITKDRAALANEQSPRPTEEEK